MNQQSAQKWGRGKPVVLERQKVFPSGVNRTFNTLKGSMGFTGAHPSDEEIDQIAEQIHRII